MEVDFVGKWVFVWVDFNVFLDNGSIIDDIRIWVVLFIIKDLLSKGVKVILGSYFGCFKGKVVDSMCFIFVGDCLGELLGQLVVKCDDCIGVEVIVKIVSLFNGGVALLENFCFYVGEEGNDVEFVKVLVVNVDFYVNDVFGIVYWAYVFIEGVIYFFSFNVVGYLIEKELQFF